MKFDGEPEYGSLMVKETQKKVGCEMVVFIKGITDLEIYL